MPVMEKTVRLLDFNIYDEFVEKEASSGSENSSDNGSDNGNEYKNKFKQDMKRFVIQMFGINEEGKKASIIVEEYQPFFYLKVENNWGQTKKNAFFNHLKLKVGKYYDMSGL